MKTQFGLICTAALVTLGLIGATEVKAQIVVITDVQYTPPAPPVKAKADPKGTMSIGPGATYRVVCDYGTITMGVFTKDAAVHAGGESGITIALAGGTHNWSMQNGPHELTNPPANLHVRARLQQFDSVNNKWVDVPGAVTYAECP